MDLQTPSRVAVPTLPYNELYSWGWNNMQLGHSAKGAERTSSPASPSKTSRTRDIIEPALLKPELFGNSSISIVSTGGSHTVVVTGDKKVYTFGRNQSGQLGHGGYNDEVSPRELKFEGFEDDPVVSVACGDRHTVFITDKGKVYVCGQNFNGQLGLGHKSNMDKPTLSELMDRRRIRKAVCGSRHTILISSKGELYTSGWGTFGQLGHGDNIDQLYSKKMELDWQAVSVATKEHINLALTTKYEVYQWGGKPYEADEKNDQQHANNKPKLILEQLNSRKVIELAVASNHCLARTSDGSLYSWRFKFDGLGYIRFLRHLEPTEENEHRMLSNSEKKLSEKHLDLSQRSIIKENAECTVYRNHFFNNEKVSSIACGDNSNFVVTESGRLFVFGKGENHELGIGGKLESDVPTQVKSLDGKFVVRVVSGYWHAFALTGTIDHFKNQLDYLPDLSHKSK